MSIEQLQKDIAKASQIVKSWPQWKQHILVESSKQSSSTPRSPVTTQTKPNDVK